MHITGRICQGLRKIQGRRRVRPEGGKRVGPAKNGRKMGAGAVSGVREQSHRSCKTAQSVTTESIRGVKRVQVVGSCKTDQARGMAQALYRGERVARMQKVKRYKGNGS